MRVAVVNWSSRRVGGIEDYVALVLPALKNAGADVAFWHELNTPLDRFAIEAPAGVADFCADEMGLEAALRALRDWKPDVLYVHAIKDIAVESQLLKIAPAVCFLHTYVGTCISGAKSFTFPTVTPCDRQFGVPCLVHYLPRGCGGKNPVTMVRLFEEQSSRLELLRRYRRILTHSDHMSRELRRHGLGSLVVPFPIKGPGSLFREKGIPDPFFRLLFAGRLEALKGCALFLDALPAATAALNRSIHAIVAGDGVERAHLEERARDLQGQCPGLTFEFTGWISQHRVAELMSAADLLVVPSLWPEPFGSVGPAAAQYGTPAAAFATGGIPQWLIDGETGHLASADPPTADGLSRAIVRCLESPAHYEQLRRNARRMASSFTMERHLPMLIESLERVAVTLAPATV